MLRELLQQPRRKTRYRSRVTGRSLIARDIQRNAERIYCLSLWICDLASFDVGNPRLGKVGSLREIVL